MIHVEPSGELLGARISGLDLSPPLSSDEFGLVLRALAHHGVICFPHQKLDSAAQVAFSRLFGELEVHVSGAYQDPRHPEIVALSNIVEHGRPNGLGGAGQDGHTDTLFSRTVAFANVHHALKILRRNGRALDATQFASMTAAHEDQPPALQARRGARTAAHDFEKFWEMMRARGGDGSVRQPLTKEQRRKKPPVTHPTVMTHPLSGQKSLYADPGCTVRINELPHEERDALPESLSEHQLQPTYRYTHEWSEEDVLVWDNLQTLHNAVADYGPDEPRMIKRCQDMADMLFKPALAEAVRAQHAP